jgi:putative membrane protein
MKLCNLRSILTKVAILILSSAIAARAADSFSDADKAFVAKVSQGGMYEVELGKLAETKALAQDIKDQGNTEAHDHTFVGDKLKSIVEANGMEFPKQLNAEFLV